MLYDKFTTNRIQQQVHNKSLQQVACNNQQVLQQVAQFVVQQIRS